MEPRPLQPGQKRVLRLFKGQDDIVFAPGDPFELRICCALIERGLMRAYKEDDEFLGYELTANGRSAVAKLV